ncbi:hypothetical protein [Agrobacterium tumefaciens]
MKSFSHSKINSGDTLVYRVLEKDGVERLAVEGSTLEHVQLG